jgi:membrane protease YdiL (CAAX protease family)
VQPETWRRREVVLLAAAFEGGCVVAALLLGWLVGAPPLAGWRWSLRDAGLGVAASVPMLAGAWVLLRWPVGPLRDIRRFSEEVIRPVFAQCTLADLALISLLAGLGEEMLFRGVLQPLFGRWLGTWPGVVLASLLFGLFHPVSPAYVLLASLMGVYFGWLVLVCEGNLLVVVLAHALYDFLVLVWLLRERGTARPGQV